MSAISFPEAKQLVLDRLQQEMLQMPTSERERPRYIINFVSYSILDLIAQVQRETEIGVKYIYDTVKQLGYVVE